MKDRFSKQPRPKIARAVSFFWGFAEATFFFIVPDFWLSRVALDSAKEAAINILFALAGALVGGAIIYALSSYYSHGMESFLYLIPGISPDLVVVTGDAVMEHGLIQTMGAGMVVGVPYKIFAFWTGRTGLDFRFFIACSFALRLIRFVFVTFVNCGIARIMGLFFSRERLYIIHAVCWAVFYIYYFLKF